MVIKRSVGLNRTDIQPIKANICLSKSSLTYTVMAQVPLVRQRSRGHVGPRLQFDKNILDVPTLCLVNCIMHGESQVVVAHVLGRLDQRVFRHILVGKGFPSVPAGVMHTCQARDVLRSGFVIPMKLN